MVTTMVAPGTVDHTIQKVLRTNIEVLDQVIGGTGHQVAVTETDVDSRAIGDVMGELTEPLLRRCEKAVARRSKAAAWGTALYVPRKAGSAHCLGMRTD